jgi:hypothetical protein
MPHRKIALKPDVHFGFKIGGDGRWVRRLPLLLPMIGHLADAGHVWTAPWQELSDVLQHWSGAVTCPAC